MAVLVLVKPCVASRSVVIAGGPSTFSCGAEVEAELRKIKLPVIIDHLGGPVAERGTSAPVICMLLDLVKNENWWVGLSNGDLRSQQGEPWDDMVAFGRMFYEAAPDRCMWGTDWPHVHRFIRPGKDAHAGHGVEALVGRVPALRQVLAGQPELRNRLNDPGLRQLKQRVALRCEIAPFSLQETAAYVAARIRHAGGEAARLFTREAVMLIHEHSRGIPRTINVMCDNALLTGLGLGRRPIDREIVQEVVRDFDLDPGHRAVHTAAGSETDEGARVVPDDDVDATSDRPEGDETSRGLFAGSSEPNRLSFLKMR